MTGEDLLTLGMLVLLQAVLGFDNLLYISLESKRAPEDKRAMVRKVGIGLAVLLRIALLLVLIELVKVLQSPLFELELGDFMGAKPTGHSLIVLLGGVFIVYTAVKEIWHMMSLGDGHGAEGDEERTKSVGSVIAMIVAMNLVFSFDSILSAMALTDTFWVMATAIVIGGLLMMLLADKVATFLERNRMFEVLGLFVLLIVGVMLLSEGGELAGLTFFGSEVHAMNKVTFYFVIGVLLLVDIVQARYQKKLMAKKQRAAGKAVSSHG